MQNLKIKFASLSLTLLLVTVSLVTFSSENENQNDFESKYFGEYFNYEETHLLLETQLMPEINVKIYNSNNQLLVTGKETEDKVKSLMIVSDLLTEIGGIKYYRLSY